MKMFRVFCCAKAATTKLVPIFLKFENLGAPCEPIGFWGGKIVFGKIGNLIFRLCEASLINWGIPEFT
jgi:hypothetical protein